MIAHHKNNYFALAALVSAILFSILEISAPIIRGASEAESINPVGLLSQYLAGFSSIATPRLVALRLYIGITTVLLTLVIGCLFLRTYRPAARSMSRNQALVIAQLLITLFTDSALFNIFVAVQLAVLMPWRHALAWLSFQIVAGLAIDLALIFTFLDASSDAKMILFNCVVERFVQVLGFGIAVIAGSERSSRLTIAASHAELLATQSMLSDMMRSSERVRIARDLHDVMGHHLTALNLHLDLALRQTEGKAGNSLRTSRQLADDLLESVRALVSAERRDQPVNLRDALQTLCSGIPAPAIVLTFEDGLEIDPPATAHALFCCVQEAITNVVRHAQADLLTIDIRRQASTIAVTIADNGRGSHGNAEGNGLRGMRERLAQQSGGLKAGNLPGRGFGLDIWVARPEPVL